MTEESLFTKSIDQTRLNDLRGEIVAFVSDFEQKGYRNGEVVRALVWAALYRAEKEDIGPYRHFMLYLQKMATDALAEDEAFLRSVERKEAAKKIN